MPVDERSREVDAAQAGPSLTVMSSRRRVLLRNAFWIGLAFYWLWRGMHSISLLSGALGATAAALTIVQLVRDWPQLIHPWIRVDAGGLTGHLPTFAVAISWDRIDRIHARRNFGRASLVIYLKRTGPQSWLRRLDTRWNAGQLFPDFYIGQLLSNPDVNRLQSFIDAHYVERARVGTKPAAGAAREV